MSRWLELAGDGVSVRDNSDNSDKRGAIVPIVTIVTGAVHPVAAMGLRRLKEMERPRSFSEADWFTVMDDCERLAAEGWAESALALGWSLHDLWGFDQDRDGLALWLRGRRLLLLDNSTAVAWHGPHTRRQWNRRPLKGAQFVWDLGA